MIYYFSSPTCEPCQKIKLSIQELQEDFPLEWKFMDLDSQIAKDYGITKVPTMLIVTPTQILKHSGTDVIGYFKILRAAD
jgi:thiol-disulfide isomerase/thioredoxin